MEIIFSSPGGSIIDGFELFDHIQQLRNEGHHITIFTSRGTSSGKDWFSFTLEQVEGWNIKFHSLKLGKPAYDLFIDDRAINNQDWYKKEGLKI